MYIIFNISKIYIHPKHLFNTVKLLKQILLLLIFHKAFVFQVFPHILQIYITKYIYVNCNDVHNYVQCNVISIYFHKQYVNNGSLHIYVLIRFLLPPLLALCSIIMPLFSTFAVNFIQYIILDSCNVKPILQANLSRYMPSIMVRVKFYLLLQRYDFNPNHLPLF